MLAGRGRSVGRTVGGCWPVGVVMLPSVARRSGDGRAAYVRGGFTIIKLNPPIVGVLPARGRDVRIGSCFSAAATPASACASAAP